MMERVIHFPFGDKHRDLFKDLSTIARQTIFPAPSWLKPLPYSTWHLLEVRFECFWSKLALLEEERDMIVIDLVVEDIRQIPVGNAVDSVPDHLRDFIEAHWWHGRKRIPRGLETRWHRQGEMTFVET